MNWKFWEKKKSTKLVKSNQEVIDAIVQNQGRLKHHVNKGYEALERRIGDMETTLGGILNALEALKSTIEEPPKAGSPAKILHPLFRILAERGQSGMPVVCTCSDYPEGNKGVYGDKWGFCKDCGERKNNLPESCFPFGRSSAAKIYRGKKWQPTQPKLG